MLNAGWDVTVFSADASPEFVYAKVWDDPWDPLRGIVRQFSPENGTPKLTKIPRIVRAVLRGRHPIPSAHWALRVAEAAIKLHQERPFDLMLTRSTSCTAHLPGLIVKRAVNLPWIANWNDPPAHLFPAPYTHDMSVVRRLFSERYLRDAARMADVNTFPSQRLMEYLKGPLRLRPTDRTAVVPHVGLGLLTRSQKTDKNVFRISHSGNLSIERDPIDFLKALSRIVAVNPDIKFELDLIGKIPEHINSMVVKLGLSTIIRYFPDLSFKACLKQLELSDALLLIEAPVENGIFFPSKIVDYCEVGRPIFAVSPSEGVMRDIMNQFDLGYFSEVGDVDGITQALERIISDWRADRIAHAGLEQICERFTPSHVVDALARLAWPNV
jgi:glycosyltransferase involved in cell wall biosynthesis